MELIERDPAMQLLADSWRLVEAGSGRIALVTGEAGIGKTSLLRELAAGRPPSEVWWGCCDALETPHPLAPLHDIARNGDVAFRAALRNGGARALLFDDVLATLQSSARPTLVVFEDVHWADEATIDLLKFLGRRIDRARCLLAISYRDDEVHPEQPLCRLVGELPSDAVVRVELRQLSPAAVDALARRALRSPDGIHAATRGNPFFVTELLRHGSAKVPRSVQDLVLSRCRHLDGAAQQVLRLVSVVPARCELWLLEAVIGEAAEALEACLNSGLLEAGSAGVGFRHELARVAVEESIPLPIARALHAAVLRALLDQAEPPSLARLVHHATRAGDRDAVLAHAPHAAEQARQREAHREAAAHYATALRHASESDTGLRMQWLEACARECELSDQLDAAIDARLQLAAEFRERGEPRAAGRNLSQLALVYVLALRNDDADTASQRAIRLLEALPPGAELAAAYRVEAQLRMLNRDCGAAVDWATRAIAVAEQHAAEEVHAAALGTQGSAMLFIDYEAGRALLHRALERAQRGGMHYIAANSYCNLGSGSGEVFRLREAAAYLEQAVAYAQQHQIDFYHNYSRAWRALLAMYDGRFHDAEVEAGAVVRQATHRATSRVMALVALGRARSRRGDPDAMVALDEALELARASGTLQRLAPVRAARAEAAWLRDDIAAVVDEAQAALALALRHRHPWFAGELALWMHSAGALRSVPDGCAEPFAMQLAGDWRGAADAWRAIGCPYEQARALADGDGAARLQALALFDSLGAEPAAMRLRRRMQASGQRGVPRGARSATRLNPHGLTERELEVLRLLCDGLKNAEIADRLCRSVRTVDHHLAAILAKLGVESRAAAVATAVRAGIAQNGQAPHAI